jgi:CubicO group peptidase (beta-lactamase class C family)
LKKTKEYEDIIHDYKESIPKLMAQHEIPGLSIAVVDSNTTIWADGFGYTDYSKSIPVTEYTVFGLQSISKTITSTAIMSAVEKGLLDLNIPISHYLPGFTLNSRFEKNPANVISINDLLGHTSGLPSEPVLGNSLSPKAPSLRAVIKDISERVWLSFPVAQRYLYSNAAFDIAGYILQVVAQKSFEDYVEEFVFDPLYMQYSSFDPEVIRTFNNRAIGNTKGFESVPMDTWPEPAGSAYSNAIDMARFLKFHLNKGKVMGRTVIEESYLSKMYKLGALVKGQIAGFGHDVERYPDTEYKTFYFTHQGEAMGFENIIIWYPEFELGIIIMSNLEANPLVQTLSFEIIKKFIAAKLGETSLELALDGSYCYNYINDEYPTLDTLIGSYVSYANSLNVTFDGENLFINGHKLDFIAPYEGYIQGTLFRFVFDKKWTLPPFIVRVYDGFSWAYNNGPLDRPGANKEEWQKYIGEYELIQWGKPIQTYNVTIDNGYLYIDNLKLDEYEPGIFFSATGDVLNFRNTPPLYANAEIRKVMNSLI